MNFIFKPADHTESLIIFKYGLGLWGFLHGSVVKNLPVTQEMWVQSLGWEDPLKAGMATHSSVLTWGIPMDRGAWRAVVHGITKSQS